MQTFFLRMKRFLIPLKETEPSRASNPEPSTSRKKSSESEDMSTDSNADDENRGQISSSKTNKAKKKVYAHKYRSEWEKHDDFKNWLQESESGVNFFKCKVCDKSFIGGLAAVKKHNSSKKHTTKMNTLKKQGIITRRSFVPDQKIVKENEIRIASFIAEHNISINLSDHLTNLIKTICKSGLQASQVAKMSCARTKCTAIINNVVGKTSFQILVDNLKNNKFSLLVDESTDVSSVKSLAMVVRFNKNVVVRDEFLALISIKDASAQNLYETIISFFNEHQIPYKKQLVGFGADGANTMMGNNHSLKTLLEQDIPDLFIMKCICHSLALCASYACEKLPDTVEKLIRNVFSYMSHSFKRQSEFKDFQVFLNIKPHKLLHPAQTRWLSLNAAVSRVLEQYEALKLYFRSEEFDKVTGALEINVALNNPINKLYLQFLEYILPTFTDLNTEFQSENPKVQKIYAQMSSAYKLLLSYYIKPNYLSNTEINKLQFRNPDHYLPLNDIYLGPKIAAAFTENQLLLSESDKREFRLRCLNFYVEAASQIYKRFPFNSRNVQILKLINLIDPVNIPQTASIGPLAAMFPNMGIDINQLDREFRLLKCSDTFDTSLELKEFWRQVCNSKRGDDESLAFPELSKFINTLLTFPHSSACVERIFSIINLNKTKMRNRLGTTTLSGILHSKRLISENNRNSCDFLVNDTLLSKYTSDIYNQ